MMDKVAGFRNTVEHSLKLYTWAWEQRQFELSKVMYFRVKKRNNDPCFFVFEFWMHWPMYKCGIAQISTVIDFGHPPDILDLGSG